MGLVETILRVYIYIYNVFFPVYINMHIICIYNMYI